MQKIPYYEVVPPPQRPSIQIRRIPIYWQSQPIFLKKVLSVTVQNMGSNPAYICFDDQVGDYGILDVYGSSGDTIHVDMGSSGAIISTMYAWCNPNERTTLQLVIERLVEQQPKPQPKSYAWYELAREW